MMHSKGMLISIAIVLFLGLLSSWFNKKCVESGDSTPEYRKVVLRWISYIVTISILIIILLFTHC